MKYCVLMSLLCILTPHSALAQWEPDQRLTDDPASSRTAENSNTWTVGAGGDTVHVVWTDNRDSNDEIYHQRSTDGGMTWGSDQRLTNADRRSWCPSVAVAGAKVHVVWEDNRDIDWYDAYYKRSTDGGATWGGDIKLSTSGLAFGPSVAATGDTVHVVWDGLPSETPGEPLEVYYARSTDGGVTWDSVTRLTNATEDYAWQPAVAAAGTSVHIAWYDGRNGPANPAEIYYKRSTDGGATWGSDTGLSVGDSKQSRHPSIAVAGPGLHVAWYDNRDGNDEIYYKRNPNGNVGAAETMNGKRGTMNVGPTIVRDVLRMGDRGQKTGDRAELLDAGGRKVMELRRGPNDVRHLSPGVYFVKAEGAAEKFIVQR